MAEAFVAKDIRLTLDCIEDVVIETDRHRVLQILVGLLDNAAHAVEASPVREKSVRLRLDPKHDDTVSIQVSDNGIGIPLENRQKIFNKGFSTKPNHRGFGLHDAANAAGAMGGVLSVAGDEEGGGATFTLRIPKRGIR